MSLQAIELDVLTAGSHISHVCEKAALRAAEANLPVHFKFNDVDVTAIPGDSAEQLVSRWDTDREAAAKAWREDPLRLVEKAEREAKEKCEREVVMVDTSSSEKEMREADVPWPKTPKQLTEYIESLVSREHDYGTCVYAMSMAATAAYHYVAGTLGTTGFQAGCADLDIIRRTRMIRGPFMLQKAEDALYPQYDLQQRLDDALIEWRPWLKEQASAKLAETSSAHPNVVEHWKILAK